MWIADGIVQTHHSTHIYIQKLGKRHKSDITNPKKVKNVINEDKKEELNPERMQKCVGNKFCADRQNKQFIDRLKSLLEQQERAEQYVLSERHYNRRGEIANDTN